MLSSLLWCQLQHLLAHSSNRLSERKLESNRSLSICCCTDAIPLTACERPAAQAKQQIQQVIEQLELQNPTPDPFKHSRSSSNSSSSSSTGLNPVAELLGDWELVYANNGTVG
jgi:hypothetical protein